MLGRLNVLVILRDHLLTFYDYRDWATKGVRRLNRSELALQLLLPGVVAALLWRSGVELPTESVGTLITALAVFGALLFNLLILVFDLSRREVGLIDDDVRLARARTLDDLNANVAFAIFLTLAAILDLVILSVGQVGAVVTPTSIAFYYLGSLFIITLLVVLRRMHLLLASEVGWNGPKAS